MPAVSARTASKGRTRCCTSRGLSPPGGGAIQPLGAQPARPLRSRLRFELEARLADARQPAHLLDALRAGEGTDLVRELAQWALQQLIEAEATAVIGAGAWERTDERITHRNGHRPLRPHPQGEEIPRLPFPLDPEPGAMLAHGGAEVGSGRHEAVAYQVTQRRHVPVLDQPGVQVRPDEPEQSLVEDRSGHPVHQDVVMNSIEETLQIDINHPSVTCFDVTLRFGDCRMTAPSGSKPVARGV